MTFLSGAMYQLGCNRQAGNIFKDDPGQFLVVKVGSKLDTVWGISLWYRGDTLIGEDPGSNYFSVAIQKVGDYEEVKLGRPWSVTDSSYRPPHIETIAQTLSIEGEGNGLQTTIFAKVAISHEWPSRFIDTAIVSGRLSVPDK